jgi:phage protein U
MANQITGKDILDMVVGKLAPEQQKQPKIVNLLQMLSQQGASTPLMQMQPTQQAQKQIETTPENIGASIENQGKPPRKNYNFLKGGK